MPTDGYIQFVQFPIPNWPWGGTTGMLKIYYNRTWTDILGVPHLAGIPGSEGFDQECPIAVDGRSAVVRDFETPPTMNAIDYQRVVATGVLFDENNLEREVLFSNCRINTTPNPLTWTDFIIENRTTRQRLADRYATYPEVLALFAQLVGTVLAASTAILGAVRMSYAPTIPGSPVAMSESDPRVAQLPSLLARGTDTLVGGAATTVNSVLVAVDSPIEIIPLDDGIATRPRVINRVAGVSFDVVGLDGNDAGDFAWLIYGAM